MRACFWGFQVPSVRNVRPVTCMRIDLFTFWFPWLGSLFYGKR